VAKRGRICLLLRRIAGLSNEKAGKHGPFLSLAQQISLKPGRLLLVAPQYQSLAFCRGIPCKRVVSFIYINAERYFFMQAARKVSML
jgi:hypothetical protein